MVAASFGIIGNPAIKKLASKSGRVKDPHVWGVSKLKSTAIVRAA
jgi:hypothetical protein